MLFLFLFIVLSEWIHPSVHPSLGAIPLDIAFSRREAIVNVVVAVVVAVTILCVFFNLLATMSSRNINFLKNMAWIKTQRSRKRV